MQKLYKIKSAFKIRFFTSLRLYQKCIKFFDFLDWIAPTQCGTKAYCKWCKVELYPKCSILKGHYRSKRHERASQSTNNNMLSSHSGRGKSFEIQLNSFLQKNKRQTEVRLALQQAIHGNMNGSNHLIDVMKKLGLAHESATLKRNKATKIVCNTLGPICRKFLISDLLIKHCSFYIDECTDTTGTHFLGKTIAYIFNFSNKNKFELFSRYTVWANTEFYKL